MAIVQSSATSLNFLTCSVSPNAALNLSTSRLKRAIIALSVIISFGVVYWILCSGLLHHNFKKSKSGTIIVNVKSITGGYDSTDETLENTDKISYIDEEGNFVFNNIPIGNYIIHVNDNLYTYTPIFIDVTKKEVKAYDYSFKNGKGAKHKIPFEITGAPEPSEQFLAAIKEAEEIEKNPNAKGFNSVDALFKDLNAWNTKYFVHLLTLIDTGTHSDLFKK